MLLRLKAAPATINIIQVYAPTADKEDEILEDFYEEVSKAISLTKKHELNLIMGDFNAKIGKGKSGHGIGPFGLGDRNERGDRLEQFVVERDLVITNTMFKLPPRRLYTWKHPKDGKDGRILRNQIDYILVNRRFRNSILSAKTYPGADIASDHNPVVAEIKLKLKKVTKKITRPILDVAQVKDPQKRFIIKEGIHNSLQKLMSVAGDDVTERYELIRNSIMEAAQPLKISPVCRKSWMTEHILNLMEERRKWKGVDEAKYKELHEAVKQESKSAQNSWWTEQCTEIETAMVKHDSFTVHKKVKEMAGIHRRKETPVLIHNSVPVLNINQKLLVWSDYIQTLFHDNRPEVFQLEIKDESGPLIQKSEVIAAIRNAKTGRAPGPDEVMTELIKLIEEDDLEILISLFNKVYTTGIIPEQWLISTFITIPKKSRPKACSEYRTISLMSHVLKIFLKIIHGRIYRKCEEDLDDTQFGFRNGFGTRDALFCVRVLGERCLDMNRDLHICFIDYEKAFDRVQHTKLIEVLMSKGLDSRDIRIIKNLYWHQKAAVKVENELTEPMEIRRGRRFLRSYRPLTLVLL
ncbi:hypothetical protein ABMA27_014867 [Loxostege sticticalis]|uniref:Reverse transcriptase domain-containing protein n=1 Tax=Loxostege sticticalis TaxID=481309 RepID=A0ABR3IAH6_LOXSC